MRFVRKCPSRSLFLGYRSSRAVYAAESSQSRGHRHEWTATRRLVLGTGMGARVGRQGSEKLTESRRSQVNLRHDALDACRASSRLATSATGIGKKVEEHDG